MAASITSAAVRFGKARAALAAASAASVLLLSAPSLAAPQGARTSNMTSLEESLIVTPDQRPDESRQPVLGYFRLTEDGWKLNMLPGAVTRTGPLPVLTQGVDAPPEDATSVFASPYAPLLRVDF